MKTFLLLISITCGILFPYGHEYTFAIRYFLMVLLFFAFLDVKIDKEVITSEHFIILSIMIGMPLIIFYAVKLFNPSAAQAAFITSIGPTAIAAPVIISLKKGNVEFVAFSLLLNNIVITLLLPFLLPLVLPVNSEITVINVFIPVVITLAIPFASARFIKFATPQLWKKLIDWKDSAFYLLILNIYIAMSGASNYIQNESAENYTTLLLIAVLSCVMCVMLFSLGWLIGGKKYAAEASQSLGQKNNAFTIWIASTYMSPVSVIGPVFYVMFQNVYISWELFKHNKYEKQKMSADI